MPVLSSAYSSYTPSSTRTTTNGLTSLMRSPYTSSSSSLSYKSRSSYDLNSYRPSSYLSSNSFKLPSSSYSTSSYYNNRLSSISSSPSSVTLTRYNQRRSSLDCNDSDISSTSKSNIPVSGLTNLGNTCYMNSVIQALYATKPFREYILSNTESGGSLYYALQRLLKEMGNARNGHTNPSSFRSQFILHSPKFKGYDQQDAQEFLRYLINGLHDEVNKAKRRPRSSIEPKSANDAWNYYKTAIDDSRLIDLFVGQFASVIRCTVCGNTSTCWDPFWDLSLPIPQTRSHCDIEKCIDEFTAQEILDDDEQPNCSRCKDSRRSTKKLSIQRSPPILILHLKKFANDGYKLSSHDIEVNSVLSIANKTYRLFAVVCHHGYSSRSGHYTAFCHYDNKWFHFNDERVTDVTSTFSTSKLPDAYLLFYQHINDGINCSSRL